jgi:Flp pilus assembly protein TadD
MFSLQSVNRCALLVLALSANAAAAQVPTLTTTPPAAALSNDPADRLAANLVILSQRPRDVNALIGAGLSAIAIGDGNAALGFLARAEEISPSNGYIKSALGSALLLVERPTEALKLFGEAASLGVAEGHFARDRGLAYDLRGESRLAQRDYATALRFGPDEEVTRRFALSLGITGDTARGLSLLDPLLVKQDPAAWRARAFILAMNGDWRSAEKIARQVIAEDGSNNDMGTFLRRLASLSPAERALAVNFGTMPSDGQRLASIGPNDSFRPVGAKQGDGLIPAGPPLGAAAPVAAQPAPVVTTAARRRPGRDEAEVALTPSTPAAALLTPKPAITRPAAVAASTRLGARIAPVPQKSNDLEGLKATVLTGVTILPPPDGVRAPVKLAEATPVTTPKTATAPTPTAIFEVPPAAITKPVVAAPPQVISSPLQVALATPPAPIAAAQPAGVTRVSAPSSAPAIVPAPSAALTPAVANAVAPIAATPTPAIVPSPAQIVVAQPPAPPTGIIGPPAPPTDFASAQPEPVPAPTIAEAPAQIVAVQPAPPSRGLGSIIASIEPEAETAMALPTAAELRSLRLAAQRKAAAAAKAADQAQADALAEKQRIAADKAKREAEAVEAAKSPARIWVQVAGGANKSGLPATFKRMRDANAELFKGLAAWSTPLNRTNRLLVGPFKSMATARDLVNKMGKAGLSVFTYTSALGQDIEKLGGR